MIVLSKVKNKRDISLQIFGLLRKSQFYKALLNDIDFELCNKVVNLQDQCFSSRLSDHLEIKFLNENGSAKTQSLTIQVKITFLTVLTVY